MKVYAPTNARCFGWEPVPLHRPNSWLWQNNSSAADSEEGIQNLLNDNRLFERPFNLQYSFKNVVIAICHFPNKTGGMSLPLRTADLTSLQRHTASPPEGRPFIANWYQAVLTVQADA
jgi:hypothetical protein